MLRTSFAPVCRSSQIDQMLAVVHRPDAKVLWGLDVECRVLCEYGMASRGLKDTVFAIAEISGNFAGNFCNFSAISGNFRQFPENFRQFLASSGNFPHSNFAGDIWISAIFQQFPAISPAFRKIPRLAVVSVQQNPCFALILAQHERFQRFKVVLLPH